MNNGRDEHTASVLPNGKVLVAGGNDHVNSLASAELYDPSTGIWTFTGGPQLAWQRFRSNNHEFPSHAVLVDGSVDGSSQIKQMYIGVVDLQQGSCHGPYGDIVPGYVQRHGVGIEDKCTATIYYAYNGKAIKANDGDCDLAILTNPAGLKLVWLLDKEGHVPNNAIEFRFIDDEGWDVVYVGRTIDSKIIGRVQPSYKHKCLYFPNFEKNMEERTNEYEVLCFTQE
ncbi:unnamed protein product [Rotaria sp. Silwood1]|nr:unnamed protein product [Rotaria sp. Silwood1]CAF3811201.1 unnamed protein product [Rotaria sp. Silwood1]CAF4941154.1 unnamed protein product [Rotaria sp. Silwood1]CAF4941440.1 unnamed protein product [Rotaria sp. Silwood1]